MRQMVLQQDTDSRNHPFLYMVCTERIVRRRFMERLPACYSDLRCPEGETRTVFVRIEADV